jgi:hypothetical protein
MRPYGREKKLQGTGVWKRDVHPPKGYVNWWENMCNFLSRSRMKQNWKKDVKCELSDNYL